MPDTPTSTYRWAPIAEASPVATAAAELAAGGLEPELALRLAPIAAVVDAIDDVTKVDPAWPGIHVVDAGESGDTEAQVRPLPPAAYVLELVDAEKEPHR